MYDFGTDVAAITGSGRKNTTHQLESSLGLRVNHRPTMQVPSFRFLQYCSLVSGIWYLILCSPQELSRQGTAMQDFLREHIPRRKARQTDSSHETPCMHACVGRSILPCRGKRRAPVVFLKDHVARFWCEGFWLSFLTWAAELECCAERLRHAA